MTQLTLNQRKFIVEEMVKTGSIAGTLRKFKMVYGFKTTRVTVQKNFQKWQTEFTVKNLNKGNSGRTITERTAENIEKVKALLEADDMKSTRKLAAETRLKRTTVRTIIKKYLRLKSYKPQVNQLLSNTDFMKRLDFCQRIKEMVENGDIELDKIIFSDECHIYLNGMPNKQNYRKWSPTKPAFNVVKPLHSPKVTVWCGLSATKIYGPFFFEDAGTGEAVTITTERYIQMLQSIFGRRRTSKLWFQQDGAPAHTSKDAMDWLTARFSDTFISHRSEFPWPPRSPDLSPLDYFLWGYVKDHVFRSKPASLDELKKEVREVIASINSEMLGKVIANFGRRIEKCIAADGGHFEG